MITNQKINDVITQGVKLIRFSELTFSPENNPYHLLRDNRHVVNKPNQPEHEYHFAIQRSGYIHPCAIKTNFDGIVEGFDIYWGIAYNFKKKAWEGLTYTRDGGLDFMSATTHEYNCSKP